MITHMAATCAQSCKVIVSGKPVTAGRGDVVSWGQRGRLRFPRVEAHDKVSDGVLGLYVQLRPLSVQLVPVLLRRHVARVLVSHSWLLLLENCHRVILCSANDLEGTV